jgi:hypothetical protein
VAVQGENLAIGSREKNSGGELSPDILASNSVASIKGQLSQAEAKMSQDALDAAAKVSREDLISRAIAEKKITEAQKPGFLKLAEQDYDSVVAILNDMQAPQPVGNQASISAAIAAAKGAQIVVNAEETFESLSKSNPDALRLIQTNEPERFAALFKAQYGKTYLA